MAAKRLLPICAITFDLDDTLWDVWPTIERAEQRLHEWLAQRYPLITERFSPSQLRELRQAVADERPDIAHNFTLLRQEGLNKAARQVGYGEFDAEAAFAVFHAARNDVVFFEDTLPALERLAQRYRLVALSNGNADIKLIGLGHLFEFAINAIEVGKLKPDPAMFEAARRYLGLAPEQIVHVGDHPQHDILGAAQAGLRTVWVNRSGKAWPELPTADAEIITLAELEALLAAWAQS